MRVCCSQRWRCGRELRSDGGIPNTCTYTRTHVHTHIRTHTHARTHTHTHTHAHTHAHTHTHTCWLQVLLLMVIVHWLVEFLWLRKIDPDQVAIPLVTAFGDLFGTAALVLCFSIVRCHPMHLLVCLALFPTHARIHMHTCTHTHARTRAHTQPSLL